MDREKHAAVFVRMMAVIEIPAAKQAKKLLISQASQIADEFAKSGAHVIDKILNDGYQKWSTLLLHQYSRAAKEFADYTLEQIGEKPLGKKGFHLSNFQRIINSFIHREALTRSRTINNTTRNIIKRVMQDGNEAGLGSEEIARNIKKKIIDVSDFRARTIARTEIHNAATFASQEVAEQSDQDLIREWVSVDDARTREWHAEANGQQRSLSDPFDVDGEQIDRPGEGSAENAINCRCSLIYLPRF